MIDKKNINYWLVSEIKKKIKMYIDHVEILEEDFAKLLTFITDSEIQATDIIKVRNTNKY